MAKVLFGLIQDLPLVLEVLAFLFGLKTKCFFHLGKITFKIFLNLHYGFWKVLCHFQQFLLAMALVQILSPNHFLTFGS